jgi:hypothetical protein
MPKFFYLFLSMTFIFYSCIPNKADHNTRAFSDSIRSESLKYTILSDSGNIPQKTTIWTPTANQIDTIASILRSGLKGYSDKTGHLQFYNLSNYYRQFVCYVNGGDSIVFINAFCQVDETENGQLKLYRFDWQHEFLHVKDGGNCYWQAIINFSKKKVESFSVNGDA